MYAILVSSIFGNSVIIHIIQKENSKKITTNYLIVNQACTADLMVSFHRYTVEDWLMHLTCPRTNDSLWFRFKKNCLISHVYFVSRAYIPAVFSVSISWQQLLFVFLSVTMLMQNCSFFHPKGFFVWLVSLPSPPPPIHPFVLWGSPSITSFALSFECVEK